MPGSVHPRDRAARGTGTRSSRRSRSRRRRPRTSPSGVPRRGA